MILANRGKIEPTRENLEAFMVNWNYNKRGDAIECLTAALRRFYSPDAVPIERKGNDRPVGMDHDLWVNLGRP